MTAEEWRPARTREELLAKFPAITNERPLQPRASTQVAAAIRAEEIVRRVWMNLADADALILDPARVPALAQRVDAAAADFHRRWADAAREHALGLPLSLRFETFDTEFDPNATEEQGVVRVWAAGTNHVEIVRDRWHDAPARRLATTSYAAGHLAHKIDTLDYWRCERYGCEGGCGLECNVRLARACGGRTRILPVNRGTFVLLFRCCWTCENLAAKIAANTYATNVKIAELEVREDWPTVGE